MHQYRHEVHPFYFYPFYLVDAVLKTVAEVSNFLSFVFNGSGRRALTIRLVDWPVVLFLITGLKCTTLRWRHGMGVGCEVRDDDGGFANVFPVRRVGGLRARIIRRCVICRP